MSSRNMSVYSRVISKGSFFSARARASTLSSPEESASASSVRCPTSVMFITWRTS